jgi:glutamine phosphoribosylpyrophosphate amidotransferase
LGWPLNYYKHVITPLTFDELNRHPDAPVLQHIRQSCQNLEINGPNTVVFVLPDNQMGIVADAKKLRPLVVGQQEDLVAVASEVCGVNMVIPDRDYTTDVYPGERETVIINNRLEVQQWLQ